MLTPIPCSLRFQGIFLVAGKPEDVKMTVAQVKERARASKITAVSAPLYGNPDDTRIVFTAHHAPLKALMKGFHQRYREYEKAFDQERDNLVAWGKAPFVRAIQEATEGWIHTMANTMEYGDPDFLHDGEEPDETEAEKAPPKPLHLDQLEGMIEELQQIGNRNEFEMEKALQEFSEIRAPRLPEEYGDIPVMYSTDALTLLLEHEQFNFYTGMPKRDNSPQAVKERMRTRKRDRKKAVKLHKTLEAQA